MVREAARHRHGDPLFLMDIAAPADIEPAAGEVENTFQFTLDDLRNAVEENADRRREAARAAEAIVEEEVARVTAWARGLEAVPVVRRLRDKYAAVAEREIERHAAGQSPEVRARLEALGRGLLNKFLHAPTVGLKLLGEQGQAQRASHYAGELFALDEKESEHGES